ncbi:MAG TPA: hypothetical protein PLM53_01315 [Spirochaetota bacterium]|nr:hypothetical protein [Spirochaetota bacterium]HPC41984.1 hypothetical protein [Spirochaetota bacterium]HPL17244.1 hypothetical protein [Spirochaetota bacterium]HQF06970.1 hypothetical protein [Spirochaetota bacterium]HQH95707.1 hypothetical protein [Spirochaetota bacterium]
MKQVITGTNPAGAGFYCNADEAANYPRALPVEGRGSNPFDKLLLLCHCGITDAILLLP